MMIVCQGDLCDDEQVFIARRRWVGSTRLTRGRVLPTVRPILPADLARRARHRTDQHDSHGKVEADVRYRLVAPT